MDGRKLFKIRLDKERDTSMKLPILYKQNKTGKIQEWKVWTKGADIHVEWGERDGKKQTTCTTATAKNVGKANEIKPKDQAEIEAKAMWKHRVDRKYSETIKEAKETVFLPMLANSFEDKKHKLTYPVDVQPKLDGLRAMAYWEGDKIVMMSRGGKDWNIPHLSEAIAKILPKGLVLDGEIYKHGLNLQGINKLAKKHREGPDGSVSLKFYAFDLLDPDKEQPWIERYKALKTVRFNGTLQRLIVDQANNEEEIKGWHNHYVEEGFEGAIVRNRSGVYTLGQRSSDLLKVKNFVDDEFEICGHYEGEGRHEGCVGFWCKTKEDKEFKCYPRGTLEQRREYGKNPKKYYGKMLKIRYQFLTDDGIPFLPIGIAIRLEEDMDND